MEEPEELKVQIYSKDAYHQEGVSINEATCRCGLRQDNYSGPSIRYEIAMVAEQAIKKALK